MADRSPSPSPPTVPALSAPAFGRVKLFSVARGYGFISPEVQGADVYVTRMHVERPRGFLKPGQRVRYQLLGREARHIRVVGEDGREVGDADDAESVRAKTKVEAVIQRARDLSLKAVDGAIPVAPGTPLAAAQEMFQKKLETFRFPEDEGDDDMTEEERQAARATSLKLMLAQQAAGRDLALSERRRLEREAERVQRERDLATPSPPTRPTASVRQSSGGVIDIQSLQSVHDIMSGVGAPAPAARTTRNSRTDDPVSAAASAALAQFGDDSPEMDMQALVSAAVAAATSETGLGQKLAPRGPASSEGHTPVAPGATTPPRPLQALSITPLVAVPAQIRAVAASESVVAPSSPIETNPALPLEDGMEEVMRPLPSTKAAVEAEILAVSTTLRFHEAEMQRLRRRMDLLKQARKKDLGRDAILTQLHLNHSVSQDPSLLLSK